MAAQRNKRGSRARPFRLSAAPLEPDRLGRELLGLRAGALVTFEGRVRQRNDGRRVRSLEYEAYPELAEKEGAHILARARKEHAILSAAGVHRTGHLRIGELAVWVGVTAEHRDAAFAACRFIIDELKERVPIWKKEHYARGPAVWINHGAAGRPARRGLERKR